MRAISPRTPQRVRYRLGFVDLAGGSSSAVSRSSTSNVGRRESDTRAGGNSSGGRADDRDGSSSSYGAVRPGASSVRVNKEWILEEYNAERCVCVWIVCVCGMCVFVECVVMMVLRELT